MISSKANVLCVLKILEEYSDENHVISVNEIIQKMDTLYEHKVDRRTVYGAIETLIEFGYDILTYSDTREGYCLAENVFTPAEIRLLIDAIFNCEYISAKQTGDLLAKLRSFISVYERSDYNYSKVVKTEKKTPNPQIFYNIAALDQAITEKRKIAFTYCDYDYDKKLKPRRDEKDVGNPYVMTCDSGHYYVAAITQRHPQVTYYRVDMMKDIEVLHESADVSRKEAGLDTDKKIVYAFAGNPVAIQLHCRKQALRYVIERFGNDVMIQENPDGFFDAHFSAAPGGVKLWALQNIESAEVVSPKSLRKEIADIIKGSAYMKDGE